MMSSRLSWLCFGDFSDTTHDWIRRLGRQQRGEDAMEEQHDTCRMECFSLVTKKSHRCTICFSQGPDFKCDTKPLARPFKVHSARLLCPHAVGLQCCNVSSRIWIGFGRYFIARLFNHWSRRLFRLCPLSFWDEESFRGDQKKQSITTWLLA